MAIPATLSTTTSSTHTSARAWRWATILPWLFAPLAFGQTLLYYAYLAGDAGSYNSTGAFGDQVYYIQLGQQLLHGTWGPSAHLMPGLPALLAVAQLLFGDPRLGIAILQGLVFAALVIGAARLAANLFQPATGAWTACLLALNPVLGYYASQALTEFLTATLLFVVAALLARYSRRRQLSDVIWAGVAIGFTGYLRSEYLAFTVVFGLVVCLLARQRTTWPLSLRTGAVLVLVGGALMLPWVARYWLVTGKPAINDVSPLTNLVLMSTFFRAFDEQTFAQLQIIERQPGPAADAVAAAGQLEHQPDLAQRYVQQVRGPYELPLGQTLQLALGNIALEPRQFLVSHLVQAPFLIWAGHTPLRQSDAARLPALLRWSLWGLQLTLLVMALWEAIARLRTPGVPAFAVALTFLAAVLFLSGVHILIAVDDRFTVPALPLNLLFTAAWITARLPRLLGPHDPLQSSPRLLPASTVD